MDAERNAPAPRKDEIKRAGAVFAMRLREASGALRSASMHPTNDGV